MDMEFRKCGACGRSNRPTRKVCFSCGANLSTGIVPAAKNEVLIPSPQSSSLEQDAGQGFVEVITDTNDDRKRLLGIVGSIILIIAVFTPVISVPILGSVNFLKLSEVTGAIVIALGIASLFLTLSRKYKELWFAGLGSLAVLALAFIRLQIRFFQAKSELARDLGDNPFGGLADLALNSIQLEWGWVLLILGAGLITAAAMINSRAAYLQTIRVLETVKLNFLNKRVLAGIALLIIAIVFYPLWTVWVERNYLQKMELRKVHVAPATSGDLGVFGEVKNTGSKTLTKVRITVYFLNDRGDPIHETSYHPVRVSNTSLRGKNLPLKPGYVREFGIKASDVPSEWTEKVRVMVTELEFEK